MAGEVANTDGENRQCYTDSDNNDELKETKKKDTGSSWHQGSVRKWLQEKTSPSCARWLIVLLATSLTIERRRQLKLTSIPLVFRQDTPINDALCSLVTSVALRSVRPSLFVGTRGALNSFVGLLRHRRCLSSFSSPPSQNEFREILKMGRDASQVAIDWELPYVGEETFTASSDPDRDGIRHGGTEGRENVVCRKEDVLRGSIQLPVVLILHGSNADATSEYVRSIMRLCTKHGWIAAGMNCRGYGSVPSIACTNDLRSVVGNIAARLSHDAPMFLVGFSLGGNLVVKYLGEEGIAQSLPSCLAGAISISNPLEINDKEPTLGYDTLEDPWDDASSRNYVQHVTIPLLKVFACDDVAVHQKTMKNMHRCLSNPNVIVMKTKTGGHLGWHHAPWNNLFGSFDSLSSTIWTDGAATKFISSLVWMRNHGGKTIQGGNSTNNVATSKTMEQEEVETARSSAEKLRSRL